ncbi:MAG: hypothetical protein IPK91_03555 [Saprospiraceae bacterium]|nr:hypothetical protein [Saprospiraceae bacterium]MBK8296359.1 hypothetical protein [Saprospiraceae bacterium]
MHDIEPFYNWQDLYNSSEDERSPFFNASYDEFNYRNKVYNYYIHPLWDEIGSETLYAKLLFADYEEGFCILEFIGEWNDCINNDIMFLKRDIIEPLENQGIQNFILIWEHVFNFHGSDDCYYEEWYEEIKDEQGSIFFINMQKPVMDEIKLFGIQHFVNLGPDFQDINWRKMNPMDLMEFVASKT